MKNQVIKVLTKEHGKKVIQFWKDRGVDTNNRSGDCNEVDSDMHIYYGVIDGWFDNYSLRKVREENAEIIELPKEEVKEDLTGRKVKGFKFDGDKYAFCYSPLMDKYIGEVGDITSCNDECIFVDFRDGTLWFYPKKEALKHLVVEEKEEKKETIFKVGDKVYDYSFGWGIVKSTEGSKMIQVEFEKDTITFIDGLWLSFTEYTLQGFSQERPIELPKVGELCLFYDHGWKEEDYQCGLFKEYDKGNTHPYRTTYDDEYQVCKRIKILD